jgi:hypothetical protein
MLSENIFMLIVRRLRSRLTSFSFGRLEKYDFHRPRARISHSDKERDWRGTTAGSVERAACPIHVPGEDAPAQIQNRDLAEISRSSKGAP